MPAIVSSHVRVRYAETDRTGVVQCGNYFVRVDPTGRPARLPGKPRELFS